MKSISIFLTTSILFLTNAAFAATTKKVEGQTRYAGPVINMINHDGTLEASRQSDKIVKMLAQEETQRACEENEKGQITSAFLCIYDCDFKAHGSDFFEAQIMCQGKCQADCTIP